MIITASIEGVSQTLPKMERKPYELKFVADTSFFTIVECNDSMFWQNAPRTPFDSLVNYYDFFFVKEDSLHIINEIK
jgi:hypothetical protein